MKLLVIAFSFSVTLLAANGVQAKKPVKSQAPAVVKPLEIPKGAVESEPGSYRHTDAQGKRWIYRKTPFGIARIEEQADKAAANPPQTYEEVQAFDEGESVRFERPSPFGRYRWKAKKSELNDMERKVWNRVQAKTAAK